MKIAFWAAIVGSIASLAGNISLLFLTGSPKISSLIILFCWLASVGILASRFRWSLLVSTLLGVVLIALLLTAPDVMDHLTNPNGPNGGLGVFIGDVFVIVCAIVVFAGSLVAAMQQRTARVKAGAR